MALCRWPVVVALAVIASFLFLAPATSASTTHRAAVIVDTGTTVKRVCVRFTAPSISGKDALDRAGVDATYRSYGGTLGSAVCSLCGVGRSFADCLGGGSSPDYWVYWRAAAGTTAYTRSSFGVSNTQVHDGDVEGWRWGSGAPPPLSLIDEVCGPPDVSPPAPPAPPAPTSGSRAAAPRARNDPSRPGEAGASAAPPTTSLAAPATSLATTTTTDAAPAQDTRRLGTRAAGSTGAKGPDGPSASLGLFAAALVGLGVWTGVARRRAARR
jgi:hypothetical protein